MTTLHTPGPWIVSSERWPTQTGCCPLVGEPYSISSGVWNIAAASSFDDANLIAQAPQLLEDCATLIGVSNVLFNLIAQALNVLIPLADEVESDDERGRLNALISKMRAAIGDKPGEVLL